MSRVILINRPLNFVKGLRIPTRKWQPLNLVYIATGLNNKEIKTEIIDARVMECSSAEVKAILEQKRPELVLVASDSCDLYECPTITMESFYKLVAAVKEVTCVRYILSIGPQATFFDEDLLRNTAVDYIIKGDNPITAINLINDLIVGRQRKYFNVSCLTSRDELCIGEIKNLENLDELPVGDYGLLPMDRYTSNMEIFPQGKFSIIITSRGCFGLCKFCFKKLIGSKFRKMSVERIKKELDELVRKNKVKVLYFLDDLFTFDYQWVYDLCRMVIDEGYNVAWGCQTRPDRINKNLLKIMKEAGCFYISYGVESGSQEVIDRTRKNIDLREAERAIKLTRELDIKAHVNVMYGYPAETAKEFNETIDFLIRNDRNNIPCPIIFFPGCEYYNKLTPNKSLKEMIEISLNLSLTNLRQRDVERGMARLNLYRMITNREYNWRIFYFIFKYFFPSLTIKIKELIKR